MILVNFVLHKGHVALFFVQFSMHTKQNRWKHVFVNDGSRSMQSNKQIGHLVNDGDKGRAVSAADFCRLLFAQQADEEGDPDELLAEDELDAHFLR